VDREDIVVDSRDSLDSYLDRACKDFYPADVAYKEEEVEDRDT